MLSAYWSSPVGLDLRGRDAELGLGVGLTLQRRLVEALVVESARVGDHARLEVRVAHRLARRCGRRGAPRSGQRSTSLRRALTATRVVPVPTCSQHEGSTCRHQSHACRLLHGILLIVFVLRCAPGPGARRATLGPDRAVGRWPGRCFRRCYPLVTSGHPPQGETPSQGAIVAMARPGSASAASERRRPPRRASGPAASRRCRPRARRRAGCPGGGRTSRPPGVRVPSRIIAPGTRSRYQPKSSPPRLWGAATWPRVTEHQLHRLRQDPVGGRLVDHRRDAALVVDLGGRRRRGGRSRRRPCGPPPRSRPRRPRRGSGRCR